MPKPLRPTTKRARRLRVDATNAETRLWFALRGKPFPYRVRRQHPVGRHIVDFAFPPAKLAIELDGGQHADAVEADATRTAEIETHGYRVIRFWNSDVLANIEGVLEMIWRELARGPAPPHPALSAPRGREGKDC
ncbi:MAG: endonuclease domain-containing protein [Alphaproteobacteria bacterium]